MTINNQSLSFLRHCELPFMFQVLDKAVNCICKFSLGTVLEFHLTIVITNFHNTLMILFLRYLAEAYLLLEDLIAASDMVDCLETLLFFVISVVFDLLAIHIFILLTCLSTCSDS